jgi:thymidylate synthase (FAD)
MDIKSVKVLDKGYVHLLNTGSDDPTELMQQARMRLKMPIFVAREWFRYQIGFSRNETSLRYSDSEPEIYLPKVVRSNSKRAVHENPLAVSMIKDINDRALETYTDLLELGAAPEVARTVLPQGMYVEFIETGSLAAYARISRLRLDPAIQFEFRLYADAVRSLLMEKFPVSWKELVKEKEGKEAKEAKEAKDEENVASALLDEMPLPPPLPPPAPAPPEQPEWAKKLIAHINQC